MEHPKSKRAREKLARLHAELEALRARAQDAEQALDAIRTGQAEALVVEGPEGPRVFLLKGADHAYRVLVEAMSEGAAILGLDGTILYCNACLAEMIEAPLEHVTGRPLQGFLHVRSRAVFDAMLRTAPDAQGRGELDIISQTGQIVPTLLSVSRMQGPPAGFCLVATDLRAQKRSEEILAEGRLARSVLDQAAEAIVVCDAHGSIITASRVAEALAGRSPLQMPFAETFPMQVELPQTREPARDVASFALRRGELHVVPAVLRSRDGSQIHLLVSASPLLGNAEQVIGCVITMTDVTERKQRETIQAQAARELARARAAHAAEVERRNKELESFSYSVAHDLRAPLRSIDGFSQALLEDYGSQLDEAAQSNLNRIRAAAQRMADIIGGLLTLARVGRAALDRARVDVSSMARAIANELQQTEPERGVTWIIPDGLSADADSSLLRILLENLLANSWKFTSKTPEPRIELSAVTRAGATEFSIRDNGAGFEMAHAAKLFEPFQRLHTQDQFSGTGVGLATVQRIVERHGGRVWATAVSGQGATFFFTLAPAANPSEATAVQS